MGLETSKSIMLDYSLYINTFDKIVISIFTIEIILRVYIYRFSFFKDGWSIFDFTIVTISLIPISAGFEILRILRLFRLFRLISVIPQMRKIVLALISVIPGMLSIGGLLSILFYIFAIMATQLFGNDFPLWFGTLGKSFYTLFQIMTLESWSMAIVRPVMDIYPLAWLFFIPFIFIVTFIMINLIIAIVVDAMNEIKEIDNEVHDNIIEELHLSEDTGKSELIELRNEIKELKELIVKKAKKD